MSAPRFYLPQLATVAKVPRYSGYFDGPEARHAVSVLRLRGGDHLALFDGQGGEALAQVVSTSRDRVEFEVLHWLDQQRELPFELTLMIALPKGDRQKTLVDAATELGVGRMIPVITQRGVAQPTESALERLKRYVVEASKQSGRNRLMAIEQPKRLQDLDQDSSSLRLVAHPYDEAGPRMPLTARLTGSPRPTSLLIGPEGGFTLAEVESLMATGWEVVDLGPSILRIEIAAIAAVAIVAGRFHACSSATQTVHSTTSLPQF
ncbi:MAG: 16S rRNA (uracil(1498)-N(3))-methyltransferase [Pirellulaceae bacterium]|nr:16S rRNA (uracil(1498)-N(3))-methyltransferase [Pirellulaceae bacterium]